MANRKQVVDLSSALNGMEALGDFKVELARAMGVAMGQEVRDEAKIRAPELQPGNEGVDNQRRGQLRDALYLAFDNRRSILNLGNLIYTVSWNSKKAPHGHLAEFGHWMPYEYAKDKAGRYYTPLIGKGKDASGKTRGVGRPNPSHGPNGFYVDAQPFLGPAFDSKLPTLNKVAADAAATKLQEFKP